METNAVVSAYIYHDVGMEKGEKRRATPKRITNGCRQCYSSNNRGRVWDGKAMLPIERYHDDDKIRGE